MRRGGGLSDANRLTAEAVPVEGQLDSGRCRHPDEAYHLSELPVHRFDMMSSSCDDDIVAGSSWMQLPHRRSPAYQQATRPLDISDSRRYQVTLASSRQLDVGRSCHTCAQPLAIRAWYQMTSYACGSIGRPPLRFKFFIELTISVSTDCFLWQHSARASSCTY